jgi:hypothetical protein
MPGRAGGAPPPQGIASTSCRADHSRPERECHFGRFRSWPAIRPAPAPLCSIGHPYGALSSTAPELAPGQVARCGRRGVVRAAWRAPERVASRRSASAADILRRTPLFDRHDHAGARLVPFAGWEMRCSTRDRPPARRGPRARAAAWLFHVRRRPRPRSPRVGAGGGRAACGIHSGGPGRCWVSERIGIGLPRTRSRPTGVRRQR